MGKGKDVLVGWLVGKAGVDFGVAQALASSEAQAAEQLKRLEETLLAQINALQKEQKIDGEIPESQVRQQSAVQAELQDFAKRINLIEAAGQQTERLGENLRAEIAALKAELVEQQGRIQPANSAIRRVEEALGPKLQALQDQLAQAQNRLDGREARLKEAFRSELIALQTQLGERQNRLEARHSNLDKLLENVGANFQSLEGWLSNKLRVIEDSSGELGQLKSELRAVAQRMAEVESAAQRAQTVVVNDAPTAAQLKKLEERLVARISELQRGQVVGGEVLEARARELSDLRAELQRFAGRIGLVESVGQQTERVSDTLRGEIAALKFELEEQRRLEPADSVIRGIESAHSAKIQELQDQIAKGQERLEGWEAQFGGIETVVMGLGGRLAEAESAAQRLQTWVNSETESAGKLSEGLHSELVALRDRFDERRSKDLAIEGIEAALGAKIEELKHHIGDQLGALEGRDGERTEWIKTLDQSFGSRMAELENQFSEKFRALESGRDESGQLRSELSVLADRIARQEIATQQAQTCGVDEAQRTQQLEECLKAEMAGLQADLKEQRQRTQLVDSLIKGIEVSLHPKIDQIGQHLAGEQARVESLDVQFAKFKSDLQVLFEQQERTASGTEQVRAWAAGESESAAKLRAGLETELSALRARLDERQAAEIALQGIEAALGAKIEELQNQLGQKLSSLDGREGERAAWMKAAEQNLNSKIQELEERLSGKLRGPESGSGELGELKSEMRAVAQRIAEVEFAAQRAQTIVASDAPPAEQMKRLEETLLAQIGELQKGLQSAGEALVGRERELCQLKVAIQDVSTGMGRIEFAAHETGQVSNTLRGELDALKAELNEQQQRLAPMPSVLRGIEAAFGAKLEELQNQLVRKQSTADGGGYLEEFKGTIQTVTQHTAGVEPAAANGGDQAAVKDAMRSEAGMVQRDEHPASQPVDPSTTTTVESPRNPGEQSFSGDTEKEQMRQVQQRMAAEIERVRAELKEKSGRWKVRKGAVAF
jgi:chromosome segregation ATPase